MCCYANGTKGFSESSWTFTCCTVHTYIHWAIIMYDNMRANKQTIGKKRACAKSSGLTGLDCFLWLLNARHDDSQVGLSGWKHLFSWKPNLKKGPNAIWFWIDSTAHYWCWQTADFKAALSLVWSSLYVVNWMVPRWELRSASWIDSPSHFPMCCRMILLNALQVIVWTKSDALVVVFFIFVVPFILRPELQSNMTYHTSWKSWVANCRHWQGHTALMYCLMNDHQQPSCLN